MLSALLFDLDGTMTDTDTLHLQAFRRLLHDHDGRELSEAQFKAQISGQGNGPLFARLFPELDAERQQALAARKEALFRELSPDLEPMPGLVRLLDDAKAHGIGLCVVTNAPRLNAEHMLDAMGLRARFEHVLAAEDIARPKPDPLPYQTGLARLGAEPGQALVFEDSLPGVKAGKAAGVFTVALCTTQRAEDLREAGADLVIEDFEDEGLWAVIERMKADGCKA
ncbi:HAD family hydrolase [Pseudomonas entomophila]|uniref:HAD family hydrolase n=1 Tax=Pseudomonas entomophila TaxID=312306 RepID=UPI003EB8F32C